MLSIYFSSYSVKYLSKNTQIMLKNFGRVCSRFSSTLCYVAKEKKKSKKNTIKNASETHDDDILRQ